MSQQAHLHSLHPARAFAIGTGSVAGLPVLAAVVIGAVNALVSSSGTPNCGSIPAAGFFAIVALAGAGAYASVWGLWTRTTVARVLVVLLLTAVTLVLTTVVGGIAVLFTSSGACFG